MMKVDILENIVKKSGVKWGIPVVFDVFLFISFSLPFYFFGRIFFLFYNFEEYESFSANEIFDCMIDGLRFDLATVFLLGAIPLLISLIPTCRSFWRVAQKVICFSIFTVLSVPIFFVNIVDAEYIRFSGRRIDLNLVNVISDIRDQWLQLLDQYWVLTLIGIIVVGLFFIVLKITYEKSEFNPKVFNFFIFPNLKHFFFKYTAIMLISLSISVIAVRGGVSEKPLSPTHAFKNDEPYLGHLRLNSVFTILKSNLNSRVLVPKHMSYEESVKKLKELKIDGSDDYSQFFLKKLNTPNIVLIVFESLSTEYLGLTEGETIYTPFLAELASKSIFFPNFFANGRRSIDALPSLIFSIPNYLPEPFISSSYQSNEIVGLPTLLKSSKYRSYFFHGGKNGTMFFDIMASRAGFDQYFGKNEYPDSSHFDGAWGIYDNFFFDFFVDELDRQYLLNSDKPFFATLFTLSSHNPYKIPKHLEARFPDGLLKIHKSVRYVDDSLKNLFEKISKKEWFSNTIFFITGDHTAELASPKYANNLGKYTVPLFIYSPMIKPFIVEQIAQQIDFLPTVLGVTNTKSGQATLFGRNLLSNSPLGGFSYFRLGGGYQLVTPKLSVFLADNGIVSFSDKAHDLLIRETKNLNTPYKDLKIHKAEQLKLGETELLKYLKATVQYHHESMERNAF